MTEAQIWSKHEEALEAAQAWVLMPSNSVLSELRQQAAAINAKKMAKIATLEDQIKALKGSMIEPAQVEVETVSAPTSEPVHHHGY